MKMLPRKLANSSPDPREVLRSLEHFIVPKKKGNAQRMMETCQKDIEARLRALSLAKSEIIQYNK